MAAPQQSKREKRCAFGRYEAIPMSASASLFLICPFKGTVLLNKGRQTALKDRDMALFTYFVKIDHRADWGILLSPPCKQLPLQCVWECTCASGECPVNQSSCRHSDTCTCTSCRAGTVNVSLLYVGFYLESLADKGCCSAATGVRASAYDAVPLWFVKNAELTEGSWTDELNKHIQ